VKGLQRRRIPAPSIAAPRRVPLSKLHPASNGGIGRRAKPLIAVTILTAGLIAAAGGPVDAGALARLAEHHAERADRALLPNDAGPGSRVFDRLSTACRRRG
jgi:hypothetical protein